MTDAHGMFLRDFGSEPACRGWPGTAGAFKSDILFARRSCAASVENVAQISRRNQLSDFSPVGPTGSMPTVDLDPQARAPGRIEGSSPGRSGLSVSRIFNEHKAIRVSRPAAPKTFTGIGDDWTAGTAEDEVTAINRNVAAAGTLRPTGS